MFMVRFPVLWGVEDGTRITAVGGRSTARRPIPTERDMYTDTENTGVPAVPRLSAETTRRDRRTRREDIEELVWSHRIGEETT